MSLFENFNDDIASKKFINSIKEASEKIANATINAEEVEKEFVPYLQQVMDSNNTELIQDIIDFIPKEFHLYSLVFLFQRIYEIKEYRKKVKFKINSVDMDSIKNSISEIFPKYEKAKSIEDNARDNMDMLIDKVIKSNDVGKIRTICGYITPYYSSNEIYDRLRELNNIK